VETLKLRLGLCLPYTPYLPLYTFDPF